MARIRTIKPEFFTSEDIVALSPMARLLYIALWCEADREGRLQWKPKTFKMRYLPADDVDIEALCSEIVDAGLAVQYGDGLAYIPSFTTHQHVNPREANSTLPAPSEVENVTREARVSTRESTVSDAQVGREGKGKEGEGKYLHEPNGSCLSSPEAGDDQTPSRVENVPKADPVEYQAVVDLYHEILCPPMQRCLILSDKRKSHLRQRWRDALPNLHEWRAYFAHIAKSDFLMGRSPPSSGRKPFIADLDWIIKSENFVKIAEGKYHQ